MPPGKRLKTLGIGNEAAKDQDEFEAMRKSEAAAHELREEQALAEHREEIAEAEDGASDQEGAS